MPRSGFAVRYGLILVSLLSLAAASTASTVVFGPRKYALSNGAPATIAESIASTASAPCTWTLAVQNDRVSSAVITWNGRTILGSSDFNATIASLERPVTPISANALGVQLKGGARGGSLTISIVSSCESGGGAAAISILSPAANTVINDRQVNVRGTVTGGSDVGVTVNGVVARVAYDAAGTAADPFRWSATVVPPEGNVTLDAVATSTSGASAADHRAFLFAPDSRNITLSAFPAAGVAPLSVTFDTSPLGAVSQVEIDYDGNGTFDYTGALPKPARFTYTTPGQRVATWRVTRADGSIAVGSTVVTVQSLAAIDAVIQRQWTAFADALAAGNINAALRLLAGDDVRARYQPPLTLIAPNLARYAAGIREIHPVSITAGLANYLLIRLENGTPHAYHVYFVPDAAGIWKIASF